MQRTPVRDLIGVLGWPSEGRIGGGYLLSHFRSTIGAAGFNFSVRNGKRWNPRAMNHLSIFQSTRIFGERLGAASTESLCRIR